MTLEELYSKDIIVFECLSGSHAYGLATPESDVDVKGIFILPENEFFGLSYVEQVSNETNDIVYYELRRFMELLSKSNPNILEMLYTPDDTIRKMHPVFEHIRNMNLLSKQCKESFGGYAMTQVRKAKGLNKKILNPVEKQRKGILDFCYVPQGQGSISLEEFLESKQLDQSECGLSKIPHMQEMYGLYVGDPSFKGIVGKETANEVALSSIPKGIEPIAIMSFNKSGYSKHCKEYKEYWDWVAKRNDVRYQNTLTHGKNYDAKNMMHTIRLLTMCEEIGLEGQLNVRREDRDYLLGIKKGAFLYEELVEIAESKIASINDIYEKCALPDQPDIYELNKVLIEIRREFYKTDYK
ncbi:nucleotidyltransferase [Marivirga lumbricoides]|uniref:Nucleotidyltransferase n=1 Tax=Marivirga lumbricoides TaxID=1046115 RepID=A0A2T4DPY8_9BACT|nr:nucleotidyltransferase [Marivirga lumbricoides]